MEPQQSPFDPTGYNRNQQHQQQHQQQQQQQQQYQQAEQLEAQQLSWQQQQFNTQMSNQQQVYASSGAQDYYAVIRAFGGYNQQEASYAGHCDTTSLAIAAAGHPFAHYPHPHPHPHQHHQHQSQQQHQSPHSQPHQSPHGQLHQGGHQTLMQQQQQQQLGGLAAQQSSQSQELAQSRLLSQQQSYQGGLGGGGERAGSLAYAAASPESQKEPGNGTSAINQLQAFALATPEAAAAAAAAAAYYGAPVTPARSFAKAASGARAPRQRSQGGAKATTKRAEAANTQQTGGQTGNPTSRSQRRYNGRASCDCPNCVELERLRCVGLEPAAETTGPNGEPIEQKLVHVCHHAGCGKEYGKTSHLRAHLRWHTSERLSACRHSDCGKRFSRTDELRKHMKTHHSNPTSNKAAALAK